VGFSQTIRNIFIKEWREKKLNRYRLDKELKRIARYPRFTEGYAYIFEKPFKFNDNLSFISTYQELFLNDMYRFAPSGNADTILDCGANMGLSVLYFAKHYPDHKILAFEPDDLIFKVLEENVKTFDLNQVTLFKQAIWDKHEHLKFFSDNGMGGRVNVDYQDQEPAIIEAVPLNDFISPQVDFLKIDIEGAEDVVLKANKGDLRQVRNIFFEYHNDIKSPQSLHELLQLVKEEGFHYYLKESATRQRPFVDKQLICERFDMAINVFCYK
jgi:FkbM family methyltransferase